MFRNLADRCARQFELAACAATALLAACNTTPARLPDGSPAPEGVVVAGVYSTAVTLERSSCVGIQVRDMPTTVSQGPGATDITLSHAGNRYAGKLDPDATFATTPHAVGNPAETHTLTITGSFAADGFTATVHADVTRNGTAACSYDVGWIGTLTTR
jgi:hypothetical protein